MRRVRALSAALLLAVLGVSATASASAEKHVVLRFAFDGKESGSFQVMGAVTAGPTGTLIVTSFGAPDGQGNLTDVHEFGSNDQPSTYGQMGRRRLCPAPVDCRFATNGEVTRFSISSAAFADGRRPIHVRFYIFLSGAEIHLNRPLLEGWTARPVVPFQMGLDRQAAVAGVQTGSVNVEALDSVSIRGPRTGSFAVALPPCDLGGVGLVELQGGSNGTESALCPKLALDAVAHGSTTWHLNAPAAGASDVHARLLVAPL